MDPYDPTDVPQPVMGVVEAKDKHDASRKASNAVWAFVGPNGPASGSTVLNWYVREVKDGE